MSDQQAGLRVEDHAQTIRRHIDAAGWAVVHVFPDDGPLRCGFSYTVGLEDTFLHPEVLVVGVTPPARHGILNVVGQRVRSGLRFSDWSQSDQILYRYPVWFRALDPANSTASVNCALDRHPDSRALHLLLPDRQGLFPWDPGTEASFASQPHGMRYLTNGLSL